MILTIKNADSEELKKWLDSHFLQHWEFVSPYWQRTRHDIDAHHVRFVHQLTNSQIVYMRMFWEIAAIRSGWASELTWQQED